MSETDKRKEASFLRLNRLPEAKEAVLESGWQGRIKTIDSQKERYPQRVSLPDQGSLMRRESKVHLARDSVLSLEESLPLTESDCPFPRLPREPMHREAWNCASLSLTQDPEQPPGRPHANFESPDPSPDPSGKLSSQIVSAQKWTSGFSMRRPRQEDISSSVANVSRNLSSGKTGAERQSQLGNRTWSGYKAKGQDQAAQFGPRLRQTEAENVRGRE